MPSCCACCCAFSYINSQQEVLDDKRPCQVQWALTRTQSAQPRAVWLLVLHFDHICANYMIRGKNTTHPLTQPSCYGPVRSQSVSTLVFLSFWSISAGREWYIVTRCTDRSMHTPCRPFYSPTNTTYTV